MDTRAGRGDGVTEMGCRGAKEQPYDDVTLKAENGALAHPEPAAAPNNTQVPAPVKTSLKSGSPRSRPKSPKASPSGAVPVETVLSPAEEAALDKIVKRPAHTEVEFRAAVSDADRILQGKDLVSCCGKFIREATQNPEMVALLLQKRADVDVVDDEGEGAIHWASIDNHTDALCLLVEAKAEPDLQNRNQRTALHLAMREGNPRIAQLLMQAKADITIKDEDGQTPLHLSAESQPAGAPACVKLVLQHAKAQQILVNGEPFVNAGNSDGQTALHIAVSTDGDDQSGGRIELVRLLCESKADFQKKNMNQRTALELAQDQEGASHQLLAALQDLEGFSISSDLTLSAQQQSG